MLFIQVKIAAAAAEGNHSASSSASKEETFKPSGIQNLQGTLIHGAVTKIGECGAPKKKMEEGDISWALKQPLYSSLTDYIKLLQKKSDDKPKPYTEEEFKAHLAVAFNHGKFEDINDEKAKNYISSIAAFYAQSFNKVYEKFNSDEAPTKNVTTKKTFRDKSKQTLNEYDLLNELDNLKSENGKNLLSTIDQHESDLAKWLKSGECNIAKKDVNKRVDSFIAERDKAKKEILKETVNTSSPVNAAAVSTPDSTEGDAGSNAEDIVDDRLEIEGFNPVVGDTILEIKREDTSESLNGEANKESKGAPYDSLILSKNPGNQDLPAANGATDPDIMSGAANLKIDPAIYSLLPNAGAQPRLQYRLGGPNSQFGSPSPMIWNPSSDLFSSTSVGRAMGSKSLLKNSKFLDINLISNP